MALYREVVNAWRGLDRLTAVAQPLREPSGGRIIIIGANPAKRVKTVNHVPEHP